MKQRLTQLLESVSVVPEQQRNTSAPMVRRLVGIVDESVVLLQSVALRRR